MPIEIIEGTPYETRPRTSSNTGTYTTTVNSNIGVVSGTDYFTAINAEARSFIRDVRINPIVEPTVSPEGIIWEQATPLSGWAVAPMQTAERWRPITGAELRREAERDNRRRENLGGMKSYRTDRKMLYPEYK